LLCGFAGRIGEDIYLGRDAPAVLLIEESDDFERAMRAITIGFADDADGFETFCHAAQQIAREVLGRSWPTVEAVAARLLADSEVTDDKLLTEYGRAMNLSVSPIEERPFKLAVMSVD
jgi:hypothetical protein